MKSKRGFITGVIMLLVGMTAGFVLLFISYSGPFYVSLIFFFLYIFVFFGVIKFSVSYVKEVKKNEKILD